MNPIFKSGALCALSVLYLTADSLYCVFCKCLYFVFQFKKSIP